MIMLALKIIAMAVALCFVFAGCWYGTFRGERDYIQGSYHLLMGIVILIMLGLNQ